MPLYSFETEDFALSEEGVHLLRNKFNFRTIRYQDVREARMERASEIRNTPVVLAIGIGLLAFAFYQLRWIVYLFTDPHTYTIYIESIVIPLLPALLGAWCLFAALRKAPVLRLTEGPRQHKLRLRSTVKKDLKAGLEQSLRAHLGPKFSVDPSALP